MEVPAPGLSIFQGGESIQINNSNNRLEEEEALEDQKRRNEELDNQLQNAFDDLIDDDDYTMNSSSHLQSRLLNGQNHEQKYHDRIREISHIEQENFEKQCYEDIEKLNKIIASKNGEIETIKKIVLDERKKNDELGKRFALSEAEKTRSQMTKQQTHELLVESKAKCSELEDIIDKLKVKNKTLDDEKNKLVCDLECTRTMLSDSQHKLLMIEKNQGFSADRHAENIIKQVTDRHNAQNELMQQQIDNLRNKLEDKEKEYKTLDTRYKELQRNREALLIDKGETINQLSKSLEESQRQCQVMMSKQDFTHENIQLKRLNSALDRQIEDMQKTINNLTTQLEATTTELELLDTVMNENTSPIIGTPRRISLTKANLVGSTPISSNDRLAHLKNEIYRNASSLKEKREKIRNLENQLNEKDNEIKILKDEENKSLVQISTYKDENSRLENRIKLLQEEINELKQMNNEKKMVKLKEEIISVTQKNQTLQVDLEKLQKDYDSLKAKTIESEIQDRKKIELNIKNLNIDLEELTQEHESLKRNYEQVIKQNEVLNKQISLDPLKLELEKHKFLLKDAQKECDRIKNLYIEISKAKEAISIDLGQLKSSDLHKELEEYKTQSVNLERALQLAELKSKELMKLLEAEKSQRDYEVQKLKEKLEKEKIENMRTSPKNQSGNCSKCIQQLAQITKFEIQNIRLENQCALYYKELSNLRMQLKESNNLITELSEKLSLRYDQEKLICDLKDKATKFEEYIKNQKDKSPTTSSSGISSSPFSTKENQHHPDNFDRQEIETKIRNEMAKIFATELKNREVIFKKHLTEFDYKNSMLKNELIQISNVLNQRQNEVDVLKHAILVERENMNEILEEKKFETREKESKFNIRLNKYEEELKSKQNRIETLLNELNEQNDQMKEERKSMKILMQQWKETRSGTEKNEKEWQNMLYELKEEHKKSLTALKAKYESAKKVAKNYQRYSEDKDIYVKQELERIKNEYQLNFTKLDNSYQANLEKKINEVRNECREIYEDRVKRLEDKQCNCKTNS